MSEPNEGNESPEEIDVDKWLMKMRYELKKKDWVEEEQTKSYIEGLEEFTAKCGFEPRRWEDLHKEDRTNGGCKREDLSWLTEWWMEYMSHVKDDQLAQLSNMHKYKYVSEDSSHRYRYN